MMSSRDALNGRPSSPSTDAPAEAGALLGEADLRRMENALLEALLDVDLDRSNALDRFLSDLDARAVNGTAPATDADHAKFRRAQLEALLNTAVSDTRHDRNRALDQILGSAPDAARSEAYGDSTWLA